MSTCLISKNNQTEWNNEKAQRREFSDNRKSRPKWNTTKRFLSVFLQVHVTKWDKLFVSVCLHICVSTHCTGKTGSVSRNTLQCPMAWVQRLHHPLYKNRLHQWRHLLLETGQGLRPGRQQVKELKMATASDKVTQVVFLKQHNMINLKSTLNDSALAFVSFFGSTAMRQNHDLQL